VPNANKIELKRNKLSVDLDQAVLYGLQERRAQLQSPRLALSPAATCSQSGRATLSASNGVKWIALPNVWSPRAMRSPRYMVLRTIVGLIRSSTITERAGKGSTTNVISRGVNVQHTSKTFNPTQAYRYGLVANPRKIRASNGPDQIR
jgi:hypothetical protein